MIVMVGVRVEGLLDPAQAIGVAQLGEDQRHQMIPTLEGLVVGVAFVLLHNRPKPAPINRFEQTHKNAIEVTHARLPF
jgi:hypothetical protein